jgi:hypothetical protein
MGFQAGDQNLYRFVGNSPTNATDPSGLLGVRGFLGAYTNNPTQAYIATPGPEYGEKWRGVWIIFDPSKSSLLSKPCDRIVFVQVYKLYIDGKPVKDSTFAGVDALGRPNHSYDLLQTADGWKLDGVS